MVGVVPNAAYRHFADRDELLAAVCAAAMGELADRMAASVACVPGPYGDADAACCWRRDRHRVPGVRSRGTRVVRDRLRRAAAARLRRSGRRDRAGPHAPGQLRTALDELVDAGVLQRQRRDGIEYPIWAAVHGLAVLAGQGPLRDISDATRHRLAELTFAFIGEGLA